MEVSLKNPVFRGRLGSFKKKQLPKKGGLGVLGQKERMVFLREVDIPMNTM